MDILYLWMFVTVSDKWVPYVSEYVRLNKHYLHTVKQHIIIIIIIIISIIINQLISLLLSTCFDLVVFRLICYKYKCVKTVNFYEI